MPIQRKTTGLNIAAGTVLIIFALQMLLSRFVSFVGMVQLTRFFRVLPNLIQSIPMLFNAMPSAMRFGMIFRSLALIFLAVCAFRGKRDILPVIGTAFWTIANFLLLYPRLKAAPLVIMGELFTFLAAALLTAMAVMIMMRKSTDLFKKIWFLPGVLALISVLFTLFINYRLNMMPLLPLLFRQGGIMSILSVSTYLLMGLWLTGEAAEDKKAAAAMAAQKNAQLCYFYDLYVKGAITAEEYERKRWEIENT